MKALLIGDVHLSDRPPSWLAVWSRFWSHVDVKTEDVCWPWSGSVTEDGYGRFVTGKDGCTVLGENKSRIIGAHRFAFFLIQGRLPSPEALHGCHTPKCCNALNIRHVHEGTHAENMQEMSQAGRADMRLLRAYGEKHPMAALTNEQAFQIRSQYAVGGISMLKLGKLFGVSAQTVCNIVHRRMYRDD